eukprot:3871099-Rhodomonas_salina.2
MSQAHQNPLIPFWRDGAEAEAAAKPPANSHAQFADRRAGMVAGANVSNRSHCDAMLLLQHSKVGSKPWMKPGSASEAGWRQELGQTQADVLGRERKCNVSTRFGKRLTLVRLMQGGSFQEPKRPSVLQFHNQHGGSWKQGSTFMASNVNGMDDFLASLRDGTLDRSASSCQERRGGGVTCNPLFCIPCLIYHRGFNTVVLHSPLSSH